MPNSYVGLVIDKCDKYTEKYDDKCYDNYVLVIFFFQFG